MKLPFISNPDAALLAAQNALAQSEDKVRALDLEREAKLFAAEGDTYLAEIARIDLDLSAARSAAAVHRDRIAALSQRKRDKARADRTQEKTAAIASISKLVAKRNEAARGVDKAQQQFKEAVAQLLATDEATFAAWPEVLPPAHRLNYCRATVHEALSTRLVQRMRAGLVRTVAEHDAFDFTGMVERLGSELIADLQAAPVQQIDEDEEDAA